MDWYDYVKADGRLKCEKCGKLIGCQTKATMCQHNSLSLNEVAAYLATYEDGCGALIYGFCGKCQRITYYELAPVSIKRIDNPYEEIKL